MAFVLYIYVYIYRGIFRVEVMCAVAWCGAVFARLFVRLDYEPCWVCCLLMSSILCNREQTWMSYQKKKERKEQDFWSTKTIWFGMFHVKPVWYRFDQSNFQMTHQTRGKFSLVKDYMSKISHGVPSWKNKCVPTWKGWRRNPLAKSFIMENDKLIKDLGQNCIFPLMPILFYI